MKKFQTLKLNDVSTDVKKAAQMLAKHGSKIKPTNVFTIGMRSAVVSFQKKHGLKVTGEIDRKTWDKLVEKPAKPAKK
jgi:peptidoglycan hydrolase-like protein with peptidoglycan-binding domain